MLRERIVEAAKAWKMSGGELSRLTGINRSSVWRYMKGDGDLSGEQIDKLMTALSLYIASRRSGSYAGRCNTPPERRSPRKWKPKTRIKPKAETGRRRKAIEEGDFDPLE